jgi:hypothetical protein
LLVLRLSSLAASVATIYFAYRIGVLLGFRWIAQILVLTYLACDQLQIFFGMGGMETQIVTAIAVATLYFYLNGSWWSLGVACGFATISRPEFIMFLLPSVGIALLLFHRRALLKVAVPNSGTSFALVWVCHSLLRLTRTEYNRGEVVVVSNWNVLRLMEKRCGTSRLCRGAITPPSRSSGFPMRLRQ